MPRKPKPPSVEESLKSVVAEVAKLKKDVAQLKAERKQKTEEQAETDRLRRLSMSGFGPPGDATMEEELLIPLSKVKQIGDIRLRRVAMMGGYLFGFNPGEKTTTLVCAREHLRCKDVRCFVNKRMPTFAEACSPFIYDKNKLTGMIIYKTMRANSKAAAEALKSGLFLVRDEGEKGLRQIKTPAAARKPKTTRARAKH